MKGSLARSSYTRIIKKYRKIGKGKVRLTQSTLILIQDIDPTTNTYLFPVLENQQAALPGEIRLDINDEFISNNIGYYVLGEMIEGAAIVGSVHHTYAAIELDGSFAQLTGAWRGRLSIEVNKINRLDRWDMKKHNIITRTQWAPAVAGPGVLTAMQPSNDFSEDGTYSMQPMLTISGAKKNTVNLELDAAIDATSAGAFLSADGTTLTINALQLALYFRGMLAQNASAFQR